MEHVELISNAFKPLELSTEKHSEFFEMWEEFEVGRNEILVKPGDIERYFYVVIEGVQALYLINKNGDQSIIGFSFDGSFSGIYDSFVKQRPSDYYLEALTPGRMLRVNLQDYNSWFEKWPEFERWGRIVHLELLVGRVNREVELSTTTAQERFEAFMERCPDQLRQIPQKYLASYLNMTPETFSRLRKSV